MVSSTKKVHWEFSCCFLKENRKVQALSASQTGSLRGENPFSKNKYKGNLYHSKTMSDIFHQTQVKVNRSFCILLKCEPCCFKIGKIVNLFLFN